MLMAFCAGFTLILLSGRHRWIDFAQVCCHETSRLEECSPTRPPYSTITTLPKYPPSGTHGCNTFAKTLQPRTPLCRTCRLPGRRYVTM